MAAESPVGPVEPFSITGYHGLVTGRFRPPDLAGAVARVADPGAARNTLHWGRNYLYDMELETAAGAVAVVVKQFRNDSWRARWRRRLRGSKARSSWEIALTLLEAGVPTPEPVMLVESDRREGPSFFASREVDPFFESRYLFRALHDGTHRERFPGLDEEAVLRAMGRLIRRMHDAGVWHRDVSIGNLLVTPPVPEGGEVGLHIIDLGRARRVERLSRWQRLRDLCRLPILERRHGRVFLEAYWGGPRPAFGVTEGLFRAAVRGFLLKNRVKGSVRAPFRSLRGRLRLLRPNPHPHIPPPPEGAGRREKVVWDHLSDQPHQHASRTEKLREYLADARIHGEAAAATLSGLARARRRYSELRRSLYREPRTFAGMGVGLRPWPERPEALLEAVEELGVRHVLLRLHPWQESHEAEAELARELHQRGLELTYALPQNRDLVADPGRWRASVETLAETFLPWGRRFQVGQAVNRSKWGIWNYHEYLDLAAAAGEVLRARGEVELLGPSVIDFEFYATAALLNMRSRGCRFDGVASLLYVDRRGAPENRQLGFDTVGKVVLLKALAEGARNSGPGSWVTEFNWPLREGPHSPAGRNVAVDEQAQADYLARFFLLALGTGLVEGAFWWQAIAKGYGLIDPQGLRRRPAFAALATLARELEGATFLGPRDLAPPAHCYLFSTASGERLAVAWSSADPLPISLGERPLAAFDRDGHPLPPPSSDTVQVTSAPQYFRLAPAGS